MLNLPNEFVCLSLPLPVPSILDIDVVLAPNALPLFFLFSRDGATFQMGSAEDGYKAIKALNGIEIQG